MILECGQVLSGRYEIAAFIGRGGIAEVYLARDRALGSEIAVKVLLPHLSDNPLVAERFRREVVAVRKVNHPNVIVLYDVHESDGLSFLTMEYFAGVDLKTRLRERGPWEVAELRRVAAAALSGLAAAHREGIVHRDVKPQNILVAPNGEVKVVDFGLARIDTLLGLTAGSLLLGTPEYAAPELLTTSLVDARADVYSMGVTLYELATGKLPFRDVTPYGLIRRQAEEKPPSPRGIRADVPEWFESVILKALAKDPSDRQQSADEMREALEAGREDETLARRDRPCDAEGGDGSGRCRRCGAALVAGVRVCFECGYEAVTVRPTRDVGHALVLPRFHSAERRAYLERDYLSFEQKYALAEFLREVSGAPVPTATADYAMKRPPVVLLDHLSEKDARDLSGRLAAVGVPADVRPKDSLKNISLLFFSRHNTLSFAMAIPTIIASIIFATKLLGVAFGFFPGLGAGLFLAGTLLKIRLRWIPPLARLAAGDGELPSSDFVVTRSREALARVKTKSMRRTLKRIAARALAILRRTARAGTAWNSVAERVRRVFDAAMRAAEEVVAIEEKLAATDALELVDAMRELTERFSRAADIRDADDIMAERQTVLEELEARRELEEARARAYARLLATPRALERAEACIEQGMAAPADGGGETLAEALRELSIEVDVAREQIEAPAIPVPAPR